MVIPIGQNIYSPKLERADYGDIYLQQSNGGRDNQNQIPPRSFYHFYGSTSVRRHTAIHGNERVNKKKEGNRKRAITEKVRRDNGLVDILASKKRRR